MYLRRRRPKVSASGFTLIEAIVVASLVLLASVGINDDGNSLHYGKEAVLKEHLFRMRDAIDQHHADKGKYPQALEDLVSDGYLREIPKDPITGSADTWQTVPAEPDAQNPSAEPAIYDVKSGSDAQALDGTQYAGW